MDSILTDQTNQASLMNTNYKKGDKAKIAALFMQGMKQCSVCRQIKPVDAFGEHKQSPNGLRSHCNLCRSRANGSFQFKEEANELAAQNLKKCRQCLETKSLDVFALKKSGRHGRDTRCLQCAEICKASKPKPPKAMTRMELIERIRYLETRVQAPDVP